MAWCTRENLTQYVLAQFLAAADKKTPGVVARSMDAVHAEMEEALLSGGYRISGTSATLTRIAAVLSAWRSVAAITTLVMSEGNTNNEWQPLLHERNRAESELAAIRKGKLDPFPEARNSGIQMDAGPSFFNPSNLEEF